ncbi:GNAT family N-acetyltransferase [Gloeocapsopsis sp. IPPAS B-1203]|uniref:GNAT family N-acetyltransferase n=1 Tax=Gloeocapsopsis sp. IPPAS B-1203 TaxID=2049454 RepID=UPI000C1A8296|nr:GNAT family N-acetyltransferase [Gloeocapsopsis sp. IPPAS B-1203]PIG93383.1 GNAT family N-acetyltransferase [Gloeocapsopsis sp. IPPAS B-1203]
MILALRPTATEDLDFVLTTEQNRENSSFIQQWTPQQHADALCDRDLSHLIIERTTPKLSVGYIILAGLENPHCSIELRRLVVKDKGKGYGTAALRLIKKLAFEQLHAHRLWLDVKDFNYIARRLYEKEGFVVEGILRECLKVGDRFESLVLMSMLQSEYKANSE